MKWLTPLVLNRNIAWMVIICVCVLTCAFSLQLKKLSQEDDILSFLPKDNPDVALFYDINKRFGGLDLALVGIRTPDPFKASFLRRLQQLTDKLKSDPGLDHVLSLTNVVDFTPDKKRGGVITAPLIRHLPKTEKEKRLLREKVLSRDHVVGNLISKDGQALLIYNFLGYASDPKTIANRIQSTVRSLFPTEELFWGGQPFVSTYIFDTTKRDLKRLTPWALLAIITIILLAFRDWIGTALTLVTTGIGIIWSMGLMALFGIPFNIVLGGMPIILFAIGSAYGIHILSRYYSLCERSTPQKAITDTLIGLGPIVLAAGLTTVVSMLSFVLMDIQPIRVFGFFTAFGILATLALSLTFIPAVVGLTGLSRKPSKSIVFQKAMVRLSVFAQTHRLGVGLTLLVLALVCTATIYRVNTSVDQTTFFAKDSPPDRAQRFMAQHFGGSQFIQLFVQADMTNPSILRQVQQVADRIALHPLVSRVRHIGEALALSNKAMVGQLRIPDTSAQVGMLYSLMAGDPAVAQLVSTQRDAGIVHIQVQSDKAEDLEAVLEFAQDKLAMISGAYEVINASHARWSEAQEQNKQRITDRILYLAKAYSIDLPTKARSRILSLLGSAVYQQNRREQHQLIESQMLKFLQSEECAVHVSAPTPLAKTLATTNVSAEPEALASALFKYFGPGVADDFVNDLAWSISTPLSEFRRQAHAYNLAQVLLSSLSIRLAKHGIANRFQQALVAALWDLDLQEHLVQGSSPATETEGLVASGIMQAKANGLPVLHRGLSHSVRANQIKSLVFALLVVVLILSILFRSFLSGLLAAAPTLLTLIVIYGGMGLFQVHLDIGTSMLASIILGIGVDYAVHLIASWSPTNGSGLVGSAAQAADRTGPAIWTNAIMIMVGFFVLTLGEAKPLQNVGGLTAAAMLVAAFATFLAIPVLARKLQYRPSQPAGTYEECSRAVDSVLKKALSVH